MSIIICRCGIWLKSVDGVRVSRCPSCGRAFDASDQAESSFAPSPAAAGRARRAKARRRREDSFVEDLAYPLRDGPGLGLLFFFPPLLAFFSIPVFDFITLFQSGARGSFNPLAILVVPFATPLAISFTLFFGYVLLYFGRILIASSMGRDDHPRYPMWDWQTIVDGVIRWVWAAIVGVGIGLLPLILYFRLGGGFGLAGKLFCLLLFAIGAGYAQMGLAAAILHDNVAVANPLTIGRAIWRIGRDYLRPCCTTTTAVLVGGAIWVRVLYHIEDLTLAAFGLWAFWIYTIYAGMVAMRSLGRCYYRNGAALGWFRSHPKWGNWERPGRIYQNS
jgi:hypothetical protein